METKEEILEYLQQYAEEFQNETEDVKRLVTFVSQHEGDELINRKNFTGHITTSAFIINDKSNRLLLLKHKFLNRWLQPGGHVDITDASLKAAALREACEETGLHTDDLQLLSNALFDIDSHPIPENIKKHEPAHVHHDLRFLFRCSNHRSINISLEESTDSNWIPFSELKDNEDFYWVEEKVRSLQ